MIGGGSGRSAGAFTAAGALATTGAFVDGRRSIRDHGRIRGLGASGARAVSGARGEVSPLARRRSIAARARSLASRRSSGAAAVSTGGGRCSGATTGAAEEFTGCTGDASMTRIFSFSRGAAAWRRWSASAGLSADFTSDLASADLDLRTWRRRLGVGFGVSLCFGFRVSFCVSFCFSLFLGLFDHRRPFGSGLLHDGFLGDSPRLDAGSRKIADTGRGLSRLGVGFGFRLAIPLGIGSRRRSGRSVRGRLAHDVVVDDVRPDDRRGHRREDVYRKFLQVIQHSGHSPRSINCRNFEAH